MKSNAFFLFLTAIVIMNSSCNRNHSERETDLQVNSKAKEPLSITEFDADSFFNNPFIDNSLKVEYQGNSIESVIGDSIADYTITEQRIENQDWTGGYYYKLNVNSRSFSATYLAPFDKSSYRRQIITIDNNKASIKNEIRIGMAKKELLKIISNPTAGWIENEDNNSILVSTEGVWIYFEIQNDALAKIRIEVGD